MTGERFTANEYVAGCTYDISCDPEYGFLYADSDGNGKLSENDQPVGNKGGGIDACADDYQPDVGTRFSKGFTWDRGEGYQYQQEVLFWFDERGAYHATSSTDQSQWGKNLS